MNKNEIYGELLQLHNDLKVVLKIKTPTLLRYAPEFKYLKLDGFVQTYKEFDSIIKENNGEDSTTVFVEGKKKSYQIQMT